mmetsp:Transcript_39531/g.60359  ORF Transcript_39531/g.60359 Transcript_39531/m.60359 type:complete len:80 (+) Transcript_39531:66-305(+)
MAAPALDLPEQSSNFLSLTDMAGPSDKMKLLKSMAENTVALASDDDSGSSWKRWIFYLGIVLAILAGLFFVIVVVPKKR